MRVGNRKSVNCIVAAFLFRKSPPKIKCSPAAGFARKRRRTSARNGAFHSVEIAHLLHVRRTVRGEGRQSCTEENEPPVSPSLNCRWSSRSSPCLSPSFLPSLAIAREQAKSTQCLAKLQQLGRAPPATMPTGASSITSTTGTRRLLTYIGKADPNNANQAAKEYYKMFICPNPQIPITSGNTKATTYAGNNNIFNKGDAIPFSSGPIPAAKIDNLKTPKRNHRLWRCQPRPSQTAHAGGSSTGPRETCPANGEFPALHEERFNHARRHLAISTMILPPEPNLPPPACAIATAQRSVPPAAAPTSSTWIGTPRASRSISRSFATPW